jgi:two-component system sensor histidine kinase ResE
MLELSIMSNLQITYLDKIVHEINGHLHIINFLSEMMLDSKMTFSEEDKKINLQQINDAAGKLARIVGVLSSVSNLKTDKINLKLEEVDLVVLLEKEVKYYQIKIRADSALKIEFNNKVQSCKTKVDQVWFGQLIANLIMNAVTHAIKGLIEVTAEIVNQDGAKYFSLAVSDQGAGIPEDELETIFQPLERGTNSIGKVKGSGIGLAVAREVVEAHKGSVVARNNPKGGAIFEVLLPLKR